MPDNIELNNKPSLPSLPSPPLSMESGDSVDSTKDVNENNSNRRDGGDGLGRSLSIFAKIDKLSIIPNFAKSIESLLPYAHIMHKFSDVKTKTGEVVKEWTPYGYQLPIASKIVKIPKLGNQGNRIFTLASVKNPDTENFQLAVTEYKNGTTKTIKIQDSFNLGLVTPRMKDLRKFARYKLVPFFICPASPDEQSFFSYFPPGAMSLENEADKENQSLFQAVLIFVTERWGSFKGIYGLVTTALILATYIREAFNTAAMVACTGKVGTGKSSLIMVIEMLAFLAVDLASITGPSTAEADHLYHPTFLMDECQQLNERNNPDNMMKLAILASRYKRGSKRVKMSDANQFEARHIVVHELGGYTILAGTQLPNSLALNDRTIPFPSVYAQPVKPIDDLESEGEAMKLRARLLAFRFRHLFDHVETFLIELRQWKRSKDEVLIRGRIREIAGPLLYIVKICGTAEQYKQIQKFFEDLDSKREDETALTMMADILDAYILALLDGKASNGNLDIQVKDITAKFNMALPDQEQKQPEDVGLALKSMGFSRYKRSGKRVKFDGELLAEQLRTFSLEIPQNLKDVLPNAPVSSDIGSWTTCVICKQNFRTEAYPTHVKHEHSSQQGKDSTLDQTENKHEQDVSSSQLPEGYPTFPNTHWSFGGKNFGWGLVCDICQSAITQNAGKARGLMKTHRESCEATK